ncbi:MAG: acetylglutamate kinase [Verrucomicrobiales bacterium]|jgi:acetylglutamate kinase
MQHSDLSLAGQIEKAAILVEALPYLQRFRGHTFVIKVGGSAMENPELVEQLLRDVVLLEVVGINPVVVHGGGKAISAAMAEAGLEPRFVNGLRVTDEAAISIVEKTLSTVINPMLVESIKKYGGKAVGIPGNQVFIAEQKDPALGYVGRVTDFNIDIVEAIVAGESVPVLSPIGADSAGGLLPFNINADLAASALASKLKATKLVFLSDVLGVMRDPSDPKTLIGSLTESEVNALAEEGIISGGMIPKTRSSIEALHAGVGKVHMIDGRVPHSLLLEVFTDTGIGTEITLDNADS